MTNIKNNITHNKCIMFYESLILIRYYLKFVKIGDIYLAISIVFYCCIKHKKYFDKCIISSNADNDTCELIGCVYLLICRKIR